MTTVSHSPGTSGARVDYAVHEAEAAVIGYLRDHPEAALSELLRSLLNEHAPELLSSALMGLLSRHDVEMTSSRHLVLKPSLQVA